MLRVKLGGVELCHNGRRRSGIGIEILFYISGGVNIYPMETQIVQNLPQCTMMVHQLKKGKTRFFITLIGQKVKGTISLLRVIIYIHLGGEMIGVAMRRIIGKQ